jgi:hypothetical protein
MNLVIRRNLKLNTAEEEEKKREGEIGTTTLEKDRGRNYTDIYNLL